MPTPIFYAPPNSFDNDLVSLSKAESNHATKVLRLSKGDQLIIIDGIGNAYRGEIIKNSRTTGVQVKISARVRNFGEPDRIVTLASGLSTGYKFDSVIEKGCELGLKRFVPLHTEKSKIKLDEPKRISSKMTRYNKVALAAAKQSRRSYIPEISRPISFVEFMKELDPDAINLLFHPDRKAVDLNQVDFSSSDQRITLIVGPESGFSDDEIDLALNQDVKLISLGDRILRTETAGPAVTAIIMNLLGEYR